MHTASPSPMSADLATDAGVATLDTSTAPQGRSPLAWATLLSVSAGAGAYSVETLGPGGIWTEQHAAVAESDQVKVAAGLGSAIRVTVTNAEATVHVVMLDG